MGLLSSLMIRFESKPKEKAWQQFTYLYFSPMPEAFNSNSHGNIRGQKRNIICQPRRG